MYTESIAMNRSPSISGMNCPVDVMRRYGARKRSEKDGRRPCMGVAIVLGEATVYALAGADLGAGARAARSAWTISLIKLAKSTLGRHCKTEWAFEASPINWSTSAG